MSKWPVVGLQRELEQILEAVLRGRGAVVLGPDGVGRSRLAIEAGERLAQQTTRVVLSLAGSHAAPVPPGRGRAGVPIRTRSGPVGAVVRRARSVCDGHA
jgi:hypothetical protein